MFCEKSFEVSLQTEDVTYVSCACTGLGWVRTWAASSPPESPFLTAPVFLGLSRGTVALLQQISTGRDKAVLRIDRSFVASQCDLSIDHVLNQGDSAQNGNCSPYPTKHVSELPIFLKMAFVGLKGLPKFIF